MTWPNGPRFVVGFVQGYKINPLVARRTRLAARAEAPKLWYVNDAAFGYKTLYEGWSEAEARRHAERLNA